MAFSVFIIGGVCSAICFEKYDCFHELVEFTINLLSMFAIESSTLDIFVDIVSPTLFFLLFIMGTSFMVTCVQELRFMVKVV